MRRGVLLAWLAGIKAIPVATTATEPAQRCEPLTQLLSPAMFQRYPAVIQSGPWRTPDVRSGEAHRYRTVLRTRAVGAPDLAGHYKVVPIGCGAGAMCPAFVDKKTGRVSFVRALRVVSWAPAANEVTGAEDHERMTYRRDSRMLAIFGTRNEDARTAGVALYEWRGDGPHLLRFVPLRDLCGVRSGR